MKKTLIIFTALLGLAACERSEYIKEKCIDGVIYLVYQGYKQGGITPKINADFSPYTCHSQTGRDVLHTTTDARSAPLQ